MAQLAVAGGGAAIGAIAGSIIPGVGTMLGAQIGWAVGGVAGALLFPQKGPDQTGPRLNDLSVQTSGYGVAIPLLVGRVKIAGNVIWKTDIRETENRRRQGKGGGPRVITYTYSLSWAVGLGQWLIEPANAQVAKIWLDTYLVYDATGGSDVVQIPGLSWRFHPGSETQLPDPLIEAVKGTGNAPAYRGLAYLVFEDVPLEQFGNRMPQVSVEVAADATRSFPQVDATPPAVIEFPSTPSRATYNSHLPVNVAVDFRRGRIYEGRTGSPGDLIRVYDLVTMRGIAEYRMSSIAAPVLRPGVAPSDLNATAAILHAGVDGYLYVASGTDPRACLLKVDPDAMRAVGIFGAQTGGLGLTSDQTALVIPRQIVSIQTPQLGLPPRTFVIVNCYRSACFTLDVNVDHAIKYVWGATTAIEPPAPNNGFAFFDTARSVLVPGQQRLDGTDLWWIWSPGAALPRKLMVWRVTYTSGAASVGPTSSVGVTTEAHSINLEAEVGPLVNQALIQSAWWDPVDDTLVITVQVASGLTTSTSHTFKWSRTGGVIWVAPDHPMPFGHDARGSAQRVLGNQWGLGANLLLQPATGEVLDRTRSDAAWQNVAWLDEQQAALGWKTGSQPNGEIAKRYLNRIASDDIPLSGIVAALCGRAGLAVSDLDVAALTDGVRGYVLARPTSAREAITPLAAACQFDAVEQDDVLLFRKRGGAAVAHIPYADLIREAPDQSVLEEQRAQDLELPQALTVRFMDVERGYEQNAQSWRRPAAPVAVTGANASASVDVPVPLTASEGKTIARRMMTGAWRERTRMACSLGPRWARLVPTDPITIGTRDGAVVRCRVVSTQLGAGWITRIEAVTEDAAAYGLTAVGDSGAGWQAPTMPAPWYVRLMTPDLPLAEDADDLGQAGLREYALIGAYDGNFRAVEVYRSADAQAWTVLGAATRAVTWGTVTSAPGRPLTPWTWDDVNGIDIVLASGEIDAATDGELLDGANLAALVGPDGQAELVQFGAVAHLGGDAWRLTRLLRGRRGSEDQIPRRRAGDAFVLLDEARFQFQAPPSEASATRYLNAITAFQTAQTAPSIAKTGRGRAERPYAPAHVSGARDGSDNLAIAWFRRTRVGGDWLGGTGTVPLNEAAEAYEVEIYDGALPGWAVAYSASNNNAIAGQAFDGTTARWGTSSTGITQAWLRVDYQAPVEVAEYSIQSPQSLIANRAPRDWTFEGWDGSGWTVLDARAGVTAWGNYETRRFAIAEHLRRPFVAYRLYVTARNGGLYIDVTEMEFFARPGGAISVARAGGLVRTIAGLSAPAASYSAADQIADFGQAEPAIPARVYQISGIVGRGIPAEVIL